MLWILQRFLGDILDFSLLTVYYMYLGNISSRLRKLQKVCIRDRRHCTWLKLRWNYIPAVLCWDLGLSNIFGCCLVNSCGGLRKGEPVQTWVHLGKSTMPGCEKGCQIGNSEQQVHLQPLCCIWSSGYTFGCVFLCPVCTHH